MAKRFTDTTKWDRENFRKMSIKAKVAWDYVTSKCDNCGIWHPDFGLMAFQIGAEISREEFLLDWGHKIVELPNGAWFIPSFIEFQYGWPLKKDCNAHKSVISMVEKHDLSKHLNSSPTVSEQSQGDSKESCGTLMDKNKSKNKDQEKNMDQEKEGGGEGETIEPDSTELPPPLLDLRVLKICAAREISQKGLAAWFHKFPDADWLRQEILLWDSEADGSPEFSKYPAVTRFRKWAEKHWRILQDERSQPKQSYPTSPPYSDAQKPIKTVETFVSMVRWTDEGSESISVSSDRVDDFMENGWERVAG